MNNPNQELIDEITHYLMSGGLVNPEMAIHNNVRDLLIECREKLSEPQPTKIAEVKLDNTGYPYVAWSGDESSFYERHPVGTKFFVNTLGDSK